jgi:hypothetical protein
MRLTAVLKSCPPEILKRELLRGVPAGAFALLLVELANEFDGARTAEFAEGGEHGVDECDGRGIGSAEIDRVNRSKEKLLAGSREGREIGVCDADAIGTVEASLLRAFDGLAETAPKTDSEEEIFVGQKTDTVGYAAGGGCHQDGQAQKVEVIAEIVREGAGQIATQNDDATCRIDALGQRSETLGVERILEGLEVFQVAEEGITGRRTGSSAGALLHGVEGSGKGQRKFVEVALKMFVGFEAQAVDDADDSGGVRVEAFGESANTQKNVLARMFEDGANDLLAFRAEMIDALGEIDCVVGWDEGLRHKRHNLHVSLKSQLQEK